MIEQKELMLLQFENDGTTLKLQFTPEDFSAIYDVALWQKDWDADKKKAVANEETYTKYLENLQEYLGVKDDEEETLQALVGKMFSLYDDDGKMTFWEPLTLAKAPEDEVGALWQCKVVDIREYDTMIQVILETDEMPNEQLGVKFNWGTWIRAKGISIPNPARKIKTAERFFNLTGLDIVNAKDLIGREVMVEVKKNDLTGEGTWLDLKKSKIK